MSVETVDTSAVEATATQSAEGSQDSGTQQTETQNQVQSWFEGGRHKFKINGVEREVTREEAERLIPLSAGAYAKFEEAAKIKKEVMAERQKLQSYEQQLRQFVQQNAHMFSGQKQSQGQTQDPDHSQVDPTQYELLKLKEELKALRDERTQESERLTIEETKKEIAKEMDVAKQRFPRFQSKYGEALLKNEYRRHLATIGDDEDPLSIEEVAFAINQELEQEERAKNQAKASKLEQNKQRAPVSAPTTGAKPAPKNTNTSDMFQEIRRQAGLI